MDNIFSLKHLVCLWKEAKETGDKDCLWRRQLGIRSGEESDFLLCVLI